MISTAGNRSVWLIAIVASLVGIGLGGCSGQATEAETQPEAVARPVDEARPADEAPLSLRMYSGGGQCAFNCWWVAELSASGEVLLEDKQGAEYFELEPDEVDEIWSILERPAMTEALQDPNDCYTVPSYVRTFSLTWPNGIEMVDETAASCVANISHPYRLVVEQVLRLVENAIVCPANADERETRGLCVPVQPPRR